MPRPSRPAGQQRTVHVPVMLREILHWLELGPGLTVLDGTVGAGGHSQHILKSLGPTGRLVGLDRDPTMLQRAAQVVAGENVTLKQSSYAQADAVLDELQIPQVDRILLDLGLSSDQLADQDRGFGFDVGGGLLDMRFDQSQGKPAAELLRQLSVQELQRIFEEYGEERQARPIAEAIHDRSRRGEPVQTASELAALIEHVVRSRGKSDSHPATRVFQALRIAANRELEQLETFLSDVAPRRLKPGGRIVLITFHSLEDRIVKQFLRETQTWDTLTPKPVAPTPSEIRLNPRSRSAKLRAAVRL